jgi:hypothetical protein
MKLFFMAEFCWTSASSSALDNSMYFTSITSYPRASVTYLLPENTPILGSFVVNYYSHKKIIGELQDMRVTENSFSAELNGTEVD